VTDWEIALGALVLLLSLSAGALLSRWYAAPHSTRPVEATDWGYCPAENTYRLHAYGPDGRRCWTCATVTPKGAGR
jgi:hypothetical protein